MSDDQGVSPEADAEAADGAAHQAADADAAAPDGAHEPALDADQHHFVEAWSNYDPSLRFVALFPIGEEKGAVLSSAAYYIIEPGRHSGLHSDNAEEIMFVTEGSGEVYIMGGSRKIEAAQFHVFPAGVPHDVYAHGGVALRLLSFFPTAEIISTYQETMYPMGTPVITSRRPGPRVIEFGPDGKPRNAPSETEPQSDVGEYEPSRIARAIGLTKPPKDAPDGEIDDDSRGSSAE